MYHTAYVSPFTFGPLHLTNYMLSIVTYVIHCRTPKLQHSLVSSAIRSIHVSRTSYGDHHLVPRPF